jgi:hypothetical protein
MLRLAMVGIVMYAAVVPAKVMPRAVTLKGWFSDKGCAASKIASGDITPNGTICVKKCLDEGATPVFIDQKAGRLYDVTGYAAVKDDVGYYLEVDATVDDKAKTITIHSTTRLGDVIQMCGRKKPGAGKG